MLKVLPVAIGIVALTGLAGCEDEENVRVREPQAEVAAPQETVVARPRRQQVVVEQPVAAAAPAVVEEGVPMEHVRRAPPVVYEGRRVYWHRGRWYYMNGGRWTYYNNEPVELRGRRYVVAY